MGVFEAIIMVAELKKVYEVYAVIHAFPDNLTNL